MKLGAWICAALLCGSGQAVEVKRLSDTEVRVKGQSLEESVTALEVLLGKRVVLDSRAKDVAVNIQTVTPLKSEENKGFAQLAILAAGCGAIETPTAFYVCRREDRAEILEALKEESGRPLPPVTKQVVLHFAEVRDVLAALRQYGGGEQGFMRPSYPVAAKNEMKLENGQFKASAPVQATTTNLSQLAQPLQEPEIQVSESVTGFKIPGGAVTGDPVNRQVILEGQASVVDRMAAVVAMLDVQPLQVMISATIGEYARDENMSLGVDWNQAAKAAGKGAKFAAASVNGAGFPFDPATLTQPAALSTPTGTSGLALYGASENASALLTALETTNRFRVVQRPVIVTLNHKEGKIYIGEQVPIAGQTLTQGGSVQSTAAISSTTQYVPVRLEIDITPHIYEGGNIRLDIQEQHNDVSGYAVIAGNQVPNISEQGLRNTIILRNGQTAVLGGLSTQTQTRTTSGVPFVSRIPVLGYLFGKKGKGEQRRELMVFVRPVVVGEEQKETRAALMGASEFVDVTGKFR